MKANLKILILGATNQQRDDQKSRDQCSVYPSKVRSLICNQINTNISEIIIMS